MSGPRQIHRSIFGLIPNEVMGRNDTVSQTNSDGGNLTICTGQDITIDMQERDIVIVSGSVNADNNTTNAGVVVEIIETNTAGADNFQARVFQFSASANDPQAMSIGPIARDSNDSGIGLVRYRLQFAESLGGTATKDNSQFSVLHYRSPAGQ